MAGLTKPTTNGILHNGKILADILEAIDGQGINLMVKDGDTLPETKISNLKFILKGGDFNTYTLFPLVTDDRSSSVSGVVSDINLTTKPYSANIGGTKVWLLDSTFYDPSKVTLQAFWGNEDEPCDDSLAALLSSQSDCHLTFGSFIHKKTIHIPSFTKLTGSVDSNATGYIGFDRTTQLVYDPIDASSPAMVLDENGKDSYSIHLQDFSLRATGSAINTSIAIARRTKGDWSNDFLSRYSLTRVTAYDFSDGLMLDHAWLGELDRLVVKMQIAGEPRGSGVTVKRGTSLSARSCFVLGGDKGWNVFTTYSSLVNCAADQQRSYAYKLGPGVTLYSCGSESQREGASLYIASSRSYMGDDAPLIFEPVKLYNCYGLMTHGSVTAFTDEEGNSGCLEAYNCTFEAGNSFIPVKPRGHANRRTFIKMQNCCKLVSTISNVKERRNLSGLAVNVPQFPNSANVAVSYGDGDAYTFIERTTDLGSGASGICIKVPAGQMVEMTISQPTYQKSDAYVTQSNAYLRFNSTYARQVVQLDFIKSSASTTIEYYKNTEDFASVYVLVKLAGVPEGTMLMVQMDKGGGYQELVTKATSGEKITPLTPK